MTIAVCIKIVDGEPGPFDASALECALSFPGGEVTVLSMCPPTAKDALLSLTRLGVRRVVLLSDPVFAGSDTLATAYVLSLALKKLSPDLILCGRETVDGDTGQVGPSLAARLGLPCVTHVMSVKTCEGGAVCETRVGERQVAFPAVLTVERSYRLRFPSLRSRLGTVEMWDAGAVGADPARCGLKGSPTRVLKTFENRTGRRQCRFVSPAEIWQVIRQAKTGKTGQHNAVPDAGTGQSPRLASVCAVGEAVAEAAARIGACVTILPPESPAALAQHIRENDPDAVLFPADVWGRFAAPTVAALLELGLCADCTGLEVDSENGRLSLYRPAKGGNILAKVTCLTRPAMATVRLTEPGSDVIVSGGRGVAGDRKRLTALAERLGAGLGASRGLVDLGEAPYEEQVGLTGRSVSPGVYVAVGISGAIQHMCGVESAGVVIAVNPDRHAPVFDYADYGFVGTLEQFMEDLS